jgi:hypothetical protein
MLHSAGRAIVVCALAIVMGSLYVITYSFAVADPVPRHIDAALVGDPGPREPTIGAVQAVAHGSLVFRRYAALPAALRAVDEQSVYAALDLAPGRPVLYVASAAGVSVARVLEGTASADPAVRVVDTHPLGSRDPNGLEVYFLMLVVTLVGFMTVFQVRANVGRFPLRQKIVLIVGLAAVASLIITVLGGSLLHRLPLPMGESWGILALQVTAVASFAELMAVLIGRWAIVPTWLFFVVLGNTSSGGAIAPPLLPAPLAFLSRWLPSGATVTALREAVYFHGYQHARPVAVLAAWAAVLFAAMVAASPRLEKPAALHKRTMWREGARHQPWPHERQFFAAVAAPARP